MIPPSKRLLAEEVFLEIGSAIVDGRIPAGTRLRDADLAAQYNVSRTPVREALQRLERIGLVEMAPSRFTRVTEPTPEAIDDAREYAGYQTGIVCAMAVGRMSAAERAHARRIIERIRAAGADAEASSKARWELFEHLGRCSGNRIQRELTAESSMALLRHLRLWRPTAEQRAMAEEGLDALEEAILDGDAAAAEQAARLMYGVRGAEDAASEASDAADPAERTG
ncbi:GntR family transcriptional regulator [Microbacterium sp. EF45047]|uniref:GntR family transcriptional regulator n=1 Tax=Microbacterium sp. EF45047 TaxID=2809708 RepID=UPI00234B7342|nr:GntR family transcriptional regulator [Microbacterium sp. EF45047]